MPKYEFSFATMLLMKDFASVPVAVAVPSVVLAAAVVRFDIPNTT